MLMPPDEKTQRRKSPRHPGIDYSLPGYWHITICARDRKPSLAAVVGDHIELTPAGMIVLREAMQLEIRYPALKIDQLSIMTDHVNLLIFLDGSQRDRPDILRVVQSFKSLTARALLEIGLSGAFWQRSFRDRYVRSQAQLEATREYIRNNELAEILRYQNKN